MIKMSHNSPKIPWIQNKVEKLYEHAYIIIGRVSTNGIVSAAQ